MVIKLIKHELYAMSRLALIPIAAMLLFAVLSRISFETSSTGFEIVSVSFYIFSLIATLIIGYCFGAHSFYQSLFTGVGYLTLSLPITADQFILSKLIAAIIASLVSVIVCILSGCIFLIGTNIDVLANLFDILVIMNTLFAAFAQANALLIAEWILDVVICIPMLFLVFFAITSIGQLFTVKNRKLMIILLFVPLFFVLDVFDNIVMPELKQAMMATSFHLLAWFNIILHAAVVAGCYFLVRYIIKNKVNLLA